MVPSPMSRGEPDMISTRPQVSRRTVAKGAAWAVPAITIAAAAPALAASESTVPPLPPAVDGDLSHGSRCQGNNEISEGKGYRVFLAVQPVDALAPTLNSAVNGSGDVQTYSAGPTPVPGKPGVHEYLVLGESSSNWLTLNYTFAGGEPQEVEISTRPQCRDYQF